MPNLIILDREEVDAIIAGLKTMQPSPYINGLISGYIGILSISKPAETVIKQAFEAGRMLSNPPELNYTIHKYKTYQDYLNFLNQ